MAKTFRRRRYQYCAANKLRASFSRCSNAVKIYFFVPSLCPCMQHHNYGVISGRHACRDCLWPTILGAELYITCRGERVLVVIRFNVTFLPLSSGITRGLSHGVQSVAEGAHWPPQGNPLKNTFIKSYEIIVNPNIVDVYTS